MQALAHVLFTHRFFRHSIALYLDFKENECVCTKSEQGDWEADCEQKMKSPVCVEKFEKEIFENCKVPTKEGEDETEKDKEGHDRRKCSADWLSNNCTLERETDEKFAAYEFRCRFAAAKQSAELAEQNAKEEEEAENADEPAADNDLATDFDGW